MANTLTPDEVLAAALALSPEEREKVVEAILASLPDDERVPLDEWWRAEVERRSAEIEAGECVLLSWDEVKRLARDAIRVKNSLSS